MARFEKDSSTTRADRTKGVFNTAPPVKVKTAPKKAKTQAEMTYGSLVAQGPGYGSQAARVANDSTESLARYIQQRTSGAAQNQSPGLASGVKSPETLRGSGGTGGGVGIAQNGGGGAGGQTVQYRSPTGQGSTPAANGIGFNETGAPVTGSIADYGYTPQGMASIYDNPTILANDVLAALGINNPGLAESIAQYLDPAIAANFLLSGGVGSSSSDAASLSYANDYMKQMVTPNGATPEFADLMNALLGAGGADSPLGAYLNSSLTPEQQISAANGLLGQTLVGLNPYAQQAYSRYAKDQGNQYLGGVAKGDPAGSSYVDYLGNTDLKQWVNR